MRRCFLSAGKLLGMPPFVLRVAFFAAVMTFHRRSSKGIGHAGLKAMDCCSCKLGAQTLQLMLWMAQIVPHSVYCQP